MAGGAYSALSGMRTRLEELDRLAADLANVGTAGYKTERAGKIPAERGAFAFELDSAVDVTPGDTRIDFRAGTIATTGRDLDVALRGRGFFVIETPAGPRYTRNGAFTRQPDGLVTTSDGLTLMGDGGEIRLGPGAVTIEEDGTVRAGGTIAGRFRVVDFAAEADLVRESGARFRAIPGAQAQDISARLVGGALEQSNVSVVDRMAALTEVSRAFEALQRGISVLMNDIDGRAIAELGKR